MTEGVQALGKKHPLRRTHGRLQRRQGHGRYDAIAMTQPPLSVRRTRVLAVASLLGLVILSLAWELMIAPIRPGGSWLALQALPLCLPLAGLLKHRMYTYRWVSLLVWLYFIEGVVRAWGDPPPSSWLACIEIALCLMLFAACVLHVRIRLRSARPAPLPTLSKT